MDEHLSSSDVFLSGVQGIPGQPGTPGGGNGMFVALQSFLILCNQTENLVEAVFIYVIMCPFFARFKRTAGYTRNPRTARYKIISFLQIQLPSASLAH